MTSQATRGKIKVIENCTLELVSVCSVVLHNLGTSIVTLDGDIKISPGGKYHYPNSCCLHYSISEEITFETGTDCQGNEFVNELRIQYLQSLNCN